MKKCESPINTAAHPPELPRYFLVESAEGVEECTPRRAGREVLALSGGVDEPLGRHLESRCGVRLGDLRQQGPWDAISEKRYNSALLMRLSKIVFHFGRLSHVRDF